VHFLHAGFLLHTPLIGAEMSNSNPQPAVHANKQREALEQSEKKAAEKQPGSFKEKATEEKVVEIGPDLTADPIKGIDPN